MFPALTSGAIQSAKRDERLPLRVGGARQAGKVHAFVAPLGSELLASGLGGLRSGIPTQHEHGAGGSAHDGVRNAAQDDARRTSMGL